MQFPVRHVPDGSLVSYHGDAGVLARRHGHAALFSEGEGRLKITGLNGRQTVEVTLYGDQRAVYEGGALEDRLTVYLAGRSYTVGRGLRDAILTCLSAEDACAVPMDELLEGLLISEGHVPACEESRDGGVTWQGVRFVTLVERLEGGGFVEPGTLDARLCAVGIIAIDGVLYQGDLLVSPSVA